MKRAPIKEMPSQEALNALLAYNPTTGLLTWRAREGKNHFNSRHADKEAGSVHGEYLSVHLFEGNFATHRLIWKMVTGEEPQYIDHIDGFKRNNRWLNLRDVSHEQNMWNTKVYQNNTSGYKGVSFIQAHGKWRAAISVNAKKRHLGYFDTAEGAHIAFCAAVNELRDEFARVA